VDCACDLAVCIPVVFFAVSFEGSLGFAMFDVVIIGGGVIGCAVARELSRWKLKIALCEKNSDVADAASKANSGIVHAGHSARPGSLMAEFNLRGNAMYEALCAELNVPFQKNGSLNVAFTEEEAEKLEQLFEDGLRNGVQGMKILSPSEIRELEPHLNPDIKAALYAPESGITSPYELTAALAENAALNGAEFFLDCQVLKVEKRDECWAIFCTDQKLESRVVVNAAGCYSDIFNNQVSAQKIQIIPRKGQYWVVDKSYAGTFKRTIFQVPGSMGKGILVTPTVDGTIMLGPTAEDQEDREDTSTTTQGLEEIKTVASRTWPGLPKHALISNFAGIRAHTKNHDFILGEPEDAPGFFNAAGIESPGLTAAPAIAQFLADEISRKLQAERNTEFNPMRKPIRSFRAMSIEKKADAIAKNPLYGRIVCRCEQVTEAEVRAAIRRPVGARTVDAVKRRTRSGMGRCQGGFCLPRVVDILSQELGQSPASITKDGEQSKILLYDRSDQPDLRQPDLPWNRASLEPSLLIIGAGPAGLAAAIAAYDSGCRDILIIEREPEPGGILRQCIHTGFGLQVFGDELSGPEYAQRYIDQVNERGIPIQCDTMVLEINGERQVTCVSPTQSLQQFHPKAIILAMGCRERPRGALGIPGTRGAGIFSAGTAQRFVNLEGYIPGKKVVILGSGDIGLIMARRMIFSGAEVVAVVEIMPFSSGLKRNVVQCLEDFGIPLLLNHTVSKIKGRGRITGVTISKVDSNLRPIPGTERELECDTLLLSVGLIPENELSRGAGVKLSVVTSGPEVDEQLQTSVPGIFACGNVLHVHDLVDHVSEEAARAGQAAAAYIKGQGAVAEYVRIEDGFGVRGIVPQRLSMDALQEPVKLTFRPTGVFKNARLAIEADGVLVQEMKRRILTPGEMVSVTLKLAGKEIKERLTIKVVSE
jgi:glycerol-3-phosphate dehydrogenase